MSAQVDVSPLSVVVWCTRCPNWSELASSKQDGLDRAVRHEDAAHPGTRAAEQRRRRGEKNPRHSV